MSYRYLKMIDKRLDAIDHGIIKMEFDVRELAYSRLDYIHALDLFINKMVKDRKREGNLITARVDGKVSKIRFRDGRLARYSCECSNTICKHILATLIAFEKESESFITNIEDELIYIIRCYKRILESMEKNTHEDDIQLLNALQMLILNHSNVALQQVISLISLGIITRIDNKYDANTLRMINEFIAERISMMVRSIGNNEEVKGSRSWDCIIEDFVGRMR